MVETFETWLVSEQDDEQRQTYEVKEKPANVRVKLERNDRRDDSNKDTNNEPQRVKDTGLRARTRSQARATMKRYRLCHDLA